LWQPTLATKTRTWRGWGTHFVAVFKKPDGLREPKLAAAEASGTIATAPVASISTVVSSAAAVTVAGAAGHSGDGRGQVSAALGIDDEVTFLALADGGGLDIFNVFDGEVEQAALAGVGGREAVGHAGLADALGGGFGGLLDLLQAESFEVKGVEADEIVFSDVEAEDLNGDVFEGAEELAAALGEQGGIGAIELDGEDLRAGVFGVRWSRGGANAVLEAQAAEADYGVEETGDLLGGLLEILNWHDKPVSQIAGGTGNCGDWNWERCVRQGRFVLSHGCSSRLWWRELRWFPP